MPTFNESLRVLIVDDSLVSRQVISLSMRGKSVSLVDTAANGKKARDMIDSAHILGKPYHIIFLDWDMPIMPGIEVLRFFRAQPQFATTAFVMVTAMSVKGQVMEAIKAGATAYLVKPVSQAVIDKKFDEIVAWLQKRWPDP